MHTLVFFDPIVTFKKKNVNVLLPHDTSNLSKGFALFLEGPLIRKYVTNMVETWIRQAPDFSDLSTEVFNQFSYFMYLG